jgi:gamma-carbonic anhydrase
VASDHFDCSFHPELIHPTVFIAETATIIGDVSIGAESSVWFGAIIRGDVTRVTIGQRSNVQDGAIIHGSHDQPVIIGNGVTISHGAIVHAASLADNVMIATRATVLDKADIGENTIIGAGAIVTPGTIIPPNSLVLGIPGKVVRTVGPDQAERIRQTAMHYIQFARAYRRAEQERRLRDTLAE